MGAYPDVPNLQRGSPWRFGYTHPAEGLPGRLLGFVFLTAGVFGKSGESVSGTSFA